MSNGREQQLAAEAAAELVEDGMRVGLGTGSTVAFLRPALARRGLALRCVATSLATETAARELGLSVEPFSGVDGLAELDIAIDGADFMFRLHRIGRVKRGFVAVLLGFLQLHALIVLDRRQHDLRRER